MLDIFKKCIKEVTLNLKDKAVRLQKCYYTIIEKNPNENNILNHDLSKIFIPNMLIENNKPVYFINEYKSDITLKNTDENEIFNFDDKINSSKMRIFLFANIYSEKKQKVLLRLGACCKCKCWINGNITGNFRVGFLDNHFIIYELNEGNNVFAAELYLHRRRCRFALRINNYEKDLKGDEGKLFKEYAIKTAINKITFITDYNYNYTNNDKFTFYIIPKDHSGIFPNDDVQIFIKDSNKNLLDTIKGKICMPVKYDLTKFKNKNIDILIFEAKLNNKVPVTCETSLFINSHAHLINEIKQKYFNIKENNKLDDADCLNVEERIKELKTKKNPLDFLTILKKAERLLEYLSKGKHFNNYLMNEKIDDVYYKSKLDNNTEKYSIAIPDNYSKDKKYPLLVTVPTFRYDYNNYYIDHYKNRKENDTIFACLTIRNIICGSYIGESSFFESLNKVLSEYNIDMQKIYLIGFSSGAYATYAYSQIYPHMFAGIAVVSGDPYLKNLCNLKNINIINIYGEKEYGRVKLSEKINEYLTKEGNALYKDISVENSYHDTFKYAMISSFLINTLLSFKIEEYPKDISFRTERIRHNKAYWIEILEFDENEHYTKVDAKVIDNNKIKLKLKNVSALRIKIPPYINANTIVFEINEKDILNINYDSIKNNIIQLKKVNDTYIQTKQTSTIPYKLSSLGMGLLDIYLDSIKIILPVKYNSDEEKEIITGLANQFSSPRCNMLRSTIYTKYPIINETEVTKKDITENNLIVFGNGHSDIIKKAADNLPISFNEKGYSYKGIGFNGDYMLMFIHPNPLNKEKKILIIYTNCPVLFNKNIFTRKLLIPTYSNGIHKYLNSEALIYDGKVFKTIYVWGQEIE